MCLSHHDHIVQAKLKETFPQVVRVEGFGRKEAAIFAEKLLHDKKKVEMVLNFEHAEFTVEITHCTSLQFCFRLCVF